MLKTVTISLLMFISVFASSAVSISVVEPAKKSIAITIDTTGKVISKSKTNITAKTSGLLQMQISQNSFVAKGEQIAKISNESREKRIEFLKKSLKLQKTEIALQQEQIKTVKEKYKMGVGSKNSYLTQKITLGQLQEQYMAKENEYETLLLEQKNSIIYTPKSGVLINLQANNSYINYGAKIATLLEKKNLIKLFVNSSYAQDIHKGMDVKIFSSYKNCTAKVIYVLPKSSNNLIEVMAETKEQLPLNLQINAQIILKESNGLLIPKSAIVLVENHPAIYIIDDKNIAHIVFIEILKDMVDKALIKNTLSKDAKIALKNAYMLHDNLEVSIK